MDALRDNPIPTILVVIAAIVGGVVVIIGALSGDQTPGHLSFETYFQTLIAGAVGLGAVRAVGQGLAKRTEDKDKV